MPFFMAKLIWRAFSECITRATPSPFYLDNLCCA